MVQKIHRVVTYGGKFSTAEHDSSQVKQIYVKIHLKSELMSVCL